MQPSTATSAAAAGVSDGLTRVAIVTPCFNDAVTIGETLASARACLPWAEVVVVDDGSDAETAAELERLADDGVAVLRQENAGPAAARMAGVAATSAPYVFPLDADDLVVPDGLVELVGALEADPEAAVAWGEIEFFGRRSRLQRSPGELDPWLITHLNPFPYASLFRREELLAAGGWASGLGYEDWDLWLALAERGRHGVHVPRTVLRYRVGPPRRWKRDLAAHDENYARLRARHPRLFALRRRNWLCSPAPWRLRVLLPLISALPLLRPRASARLRALVVYPGAFVPLAGRARRGRGLLRTLLGRSPGRAPGRASGP